MQVGMRVFRLRRTCIDVQYICMYLSYESLFCEGKRTWKTCPAALSQHPLRGFTGVLPSCMKFQCTSLIPLLPSLPLHTYKLNVVYIKFSLKIFLLIVATGSRVRGNGNSELITLISVTLHSTVQVLTLGVEEG